MNIDSHPYLQLLERLGSPVISSGTAYPENPHPNQLFWRTDLDRLDYWDVGSSTWKQSEAAAMKETDFVERVYRSLMLPGGTGAGGWTATSGTAYFVYLRQMPKTITLKYVRFHLVTLASGVTAAELGLFSTDGPPDYSGKTFTKIIATGSIDSLVSPAVVGMKKNSSSFDQEVERGTHLWAGCRFAASTPPTVRALGNDLESGALQYTSSATSFTSGSTWSGSILAAVTGLTGPDLIATAD